MGAICSVGEKWYGLLYSWADSKKKSNLMLSIFEPGIPIKVNSSEYSDPTKYVLNLKEQSAFLG